MASRLEEETNFKLSLKSSLEVILAITLAAQFKGLCHDPRKLEITFNMSQMLNGLHQPNAYLLL
uniref:Uncharacterized protein n=1 Tax=Rhizophora mucronata TaxID=61149 RepID=A0A2P2NIK6_RHIMU